jgi:hypothetical protein
MTIIFRALRIPRKVELDPNWLLKGVAPRCRPIRASEFQRAVGAKLIDRKTASNLLRILSTVSADDAWHIQLQRLIGIKNLSRSEASQEKKRQLQETLRRGLAEIERKKKGS